MKQPIGILLHPYCLSHQCKHDLMDLLTAAIEHKRLSKQTPVVKYELHAGFAVLKDIP